MKTLPDAISVGTQSQTLSLTTRVNNQTPNASKTHPDAWIDLNEPDMPRIFGNYELESLIAPGGMGMVYKARNRTTGASVALKTIRKDFLVTPDMAMRFRREVQAGELIHPNIMPVIDAGESNGRPFLVMPLARDSLHRQMERYREPKAAARLIALVARGVDAAHRRGVVHRDLKPANILLDDSEAPRVADFGLAKLIDDLDTMSLTVTGAVLGTPPYMAPEQAFGSREDIGPSVDVWALGIILYELVTGQRPFDGPRREATLERIRKIDPPPPRQWTPTLDRQLETIILTCLEKEPKHRYASAGALADDLEAWLAGEAIKARRRWWATWLKPVTSSWKSWAPAAVGVVALLLIIVALASALNMGDDPTTMIPQTEALAELQQEIDAGRPVRLVGPGQRPRWYDWLMSKLGSSSIRQKNGVTIIESQNFDMLALFKPGPKYFRIEAVMRLLDSDARLGSGLEVFFGYQRLTQPQKTYDAYYAFSELGRTGTKFKPQHALNFTVHLTGNHPWQVVNFRDRPPEQHTGDWPHRYVVEVTPNQFLAQRDNETPLVTTANIVERELTFAEKQMGQPAELHTKKRNGPLGVALSHCAIEIHSFTLTPLHFED